MQAFKEINRWKYCKVCKKIFRKLWDVYSCLREKSRIENATQVLRQRFHDEIREAILIIDAKNAFKS